MIHAITSPHFSTKKLKFYAIKNLKVHNIFIWKFVANLFVRKNVNTWMYTFRNPNTVTYICMYSTIWV